jgi:hypothetical protein
MEKNKNNHENAKYEKHENYHGFFVVSYFRDFVIKIFSVVHPGWFKVAYE